MKWYTDPVILAVAVFLVCSFFTIGYVLLVPA